MEASKNPSNGNLLHLTSEQRPLLLQAICHFLESSGFSRTLKKFLSEASIQRGSWKSCLLDLEDACCMYLVSRSQNNANDISINYDKRSVKIVGVDANVKSKKKKKKKSENECPSQDVNVCRTEAEGALGDILCEEKSSKKAKDKKKKERESVSEKNKTEADEGLYTKSLENGVEEKNIKQSMAKSEEASEQEKKSSKKRKMSLPEENKVDALGEASTDSKHKKIGSADGETDGKTERATMQLESGQVGSQTPSSTNGKYSEVLVEENDGDKSALKKNSAKKQTGSAEPRTLNAFQRVKAEEVEFVDERLQDNSYWAKDGAETGYGAKAQEVLCQVRGRDFRHEKTKKKRGSYRGGQIDLQSHSVKFSYSDEDE